jgi:hypothetical protein
MGLGLKEVWGGKGSKPLLDVENNLYDMSNLFFNSGAQWLKSIIFCCNEYYCCCKFFLLL